MVATEALAHGLPVITTTAGGLLEALGTTADGERPGLLVPAGDAPALARRHFHVVDRRGPAGASAAAAYAEAARAADLVDDNRAG